MSLEHLDLPRFDEEKIDPEPDAPPVAGLSFLLELPHCLRIDGLAFVVSDRGESWPGWGPDALGHMAGMSAPMPEVDLKPRIRVEVAQTRVDGWTPLLAAERSFSDWEGVATPSAPSRGVTARGADELRTSVQITIYELAEETPLGNGEDDHERFLHQTTEWLSRRLDEALAFLNQYVVILAGMRDEWQISSLSRIDLPRDAPWKLDLHPAPDGWEGPRGTLDAHATIPDDLPETRTEEEILQAIDVVQEARAGRVPFFQFVELYQAAEHHLGSGRNDQSVIAACTATEVLLNTLFRVLWISLERDPDKLGGVLGAPFKNQLTDLLPKFLDQPLDLADLSSPPGQWHAECYLLRNRIVHNGTKATAGQAYDSKVATGDFSRWVGRSLRADPQTEWVKAFLAQRME